MDKVLEHLRKSWKTTALVVAALLIGGGIATAGAKDSGDELETVAAKLSRSQDALIAAQDENSTLTSDKAAVEDDLERTQDDLDDAKDDLAELQDEYDFVTRNLTKMEEDLEGKLAKVDSRLAELDDLEASARQQEAAARDLRRELDKELGIVRNSKFGDGVWKVGTEITPGIYRASAGSSCYWAILNSADTSNIANNGGFTKNQTVTLTDGKWFETSGCGQWTKIG